MTTRDRLQASLGNTYTLERELTGGGMAQVFLAEEKGLGRRVVVKMLPADLVGSVNVERFSREIQVAAQLQHPCILPVLSAGDADGVPYYTMPFVDGKSLRDRLSEGGELSIPETLKALHDLAAGLAYAHDRGIVHRDIKPGNILLSDGYALITDFGVAKALFASAAERLTTSGIAIGTPSYMSPEQASGDPHVDQRADIYAVGCVAYEMLVGQPPFGGRSLQAVSAAHLTETPDLVTTHRPSVPEPLSRLIARCLEKRPADRPQSARALLQELDAVAAPIGGATAAQPRVPASTDWRTKKAWLIPILAVAVVVVGVVAAQLAARSHSNAPTGAVSFFLSPTGSEDIDGSSVAVSRDGLRIAYVASDSGKSRIYVRAIDAPQARVLAGTDGARRPTFSPDGASLAYFADGALQLVSVDGGASQRVGSGVASSRWSYSWIDQDRIIIPTFNLIARRSGLSEITVSTGRVRALIASDSARGENLISPHVAPNQKDVLMVSGGPGGLEDDFLAFGSIDGGPRVVTKELAASVLGMYEDFAIYLKGNGLTTSTITAVRIDLKHHRTIGSPVVLLDGVRAATLSNTGTLVYGAGQSAAEVVWIDATGAQTVILPATSDRATPRLSPDNTTLAFVAPGNPTTEVWTYNFASQALTKLTAAGGQDPDWTPDGKSILYNRPTTALAGLWLARVDRSTPPVRLRPLVGGKPVVALSAVMAPDGRTIMFTTIDGAHIGAYFYVPSSGNDDAVVWNPGTDVIEPRFSPDQKWLAYTSTESGVSEVFVRAFPGPGPRVQISPDGADKPLWSRDGTTIYYRHGAKIVAAKIAMQPSVVVQSRRDAFPVTGACLGSMPYDISRDGKRLICARGRDLAVKTVVTAHWFDEVRRRLGK